MESDKPALRADLRARVQRHAPALIDRLLRLAESDNDATALRACSLLIELGYGRTPVASDATDNPGNFRVVTTPLARTPLADLPEGMAKREGIPAYHPGDEPSGMHTGTTPGDFRGRGNRIA